MERHFNLGYNNDLENPDYLYLGTAKMIDFEELKMNNYKNPSFKMILTSHYNEACANAFAEKLRDNNKDREYSIEVHGTSIPILVADNVNDLKDNTTVYVYAFMYDEIFKNEGNHQFSIEEVVKPFSMTEIAYKDYKVYYRINQSKEKIKELSIKV